MTAARASWWPTHSDNGVRLTLHQERDPRLSGGISSPFPVPEEGTLRRFTGITEAIRGTRLTLQSPPDRHRHVRVKVRGHEEPDGTRAGPRCLARYQDDGEPIETSTKEAASPAATRGQSAARNRSRQLTRGSTARSAGFSPLMGLNFLSGRPRCYALKSIPNSDIAQGRPATCHGPSRRGTGERVGQTAFATPCAPLSRRQKSPSRSQTETTRIRGPITRSQQRSPQDSAAERP